MYMVIVRGKTVRIVREILAEISNPKSSSIKDQKIKNGPLSCSFSRANWIHLPTL